MALRLTKKFIDCLDFLKFIMVENFKRQLLGLKLFSPIVPYVEIYKRFVSVITNFIILGVDVFIRRIPLKNFLCSRDNTVNPRISGGARGNLNSLTFS